MKKKLLALLLACLLLLGAAPLGILAGAAAPPAEALAATLAAIEAYNSTHGGIGALAADASGDEIVVTGEAKDVTKGLVLPHKANWKAKLNGDTEGEALIRGTVTVLLGAEIFTDGRAVEGLEIHVQGGVIAGAEAIYSPGGIVQITGGIVVGNIYASELSIENARVDIDDGAGLENSVVYIAPTATTNLEDKLTNYIEDNGQGLLTVIGDVTLNSPLEFEVLYIPDDAKLTINANDFALPEDTLLIVDGKLVLPEGYDFSEWKGTVTGQNVDDFGEDLPGDGDDDDDGNSTEPTLKWWQRLPDWAQWSLRYICFGWIWM